MPIDDTYASYSNSGVDGPLENAAPIAPDDDADLAWMTRSIQVATAGNVTVVMKGGMTVTLPALQPGAVYGYRVRRILASGTTATGIVVGW